MALMGCDSTVQKLLGQVCESLEGGKNHGIDDEERVVFEERLYAAIVGLDVLLGPGLVDKAIQQCKSNGAFVNNVAAKSAFHGQKKIMVKYRADGSGRTCYTVKGDNRTYLVLENYCGCQSYTKRIESSGLPLCKHLLAIKFAQVLDILPTENISDESYAKLVLRRYQ